MALHAPGALTRLLSRLRRSVLTRGRSAAEAGAETGFRTLEHVELALRAAGIGLWEWDVEADKMAWSEEHERLAGLPPGGFGGRTVDFLELMHPDDRAQMESVVGFRDGSGSFGGAYRVVLGDGSVRWLEGKGTLFDSLEGRVVAVGITQDITQQRETELRRQAADQKAVEVVEASSAAFVALESDWTISYINRAGESLVGRNRSELLGTSVWDVPDVAGSDFEPYYRQVMLDRVPVEFEAFWRTVGRWLDVRVFPTATGISVYLDDVTDRHRLEDDLRQAHKMQAVGQLAGGVAHDFNNLLTAISGYAGLLANRSEMSSEAQEQIHQIGRAADRAAELTRQLLAFSRRQRLVPAVIEPNELVRDAVPMLKRLIGEHIQVDVAAEPHLRPIYADAAQIEQILMNLVVNAAQAMPRGGTITVSTENVTIDSERGFADVDAGDYVALTVADTGCGMDEATAARAFDPFFTTKEDGTGTGLGLATVHGIAKQSGGTTRIASRVGEGTRVTVYLPVTDAEPVAAGPPTPGTSGAEPTEAVLLVDDNAAVRTVVAQMLSSHGYDVTVAASPVEAIALVEEGARPDVLVTDVVMPGIGGPELAERLTRIDPTLRTVLASGYSEHSLFSGDGAQVDAVFLQKPFTADEISAAIRAAATRR